MTERGTHLLRQHRMKMLISKKTPISLWTSAAERLLLLTSNRCRYLSRPNIISASCC